jgi:DNA-binding transcriptional LysR family regulator
MATITAIADFGSFSRAAEAVNLTQSAVSQQMRELESLLNVSLFDRESRPPKLTADGRAYVAIARNVLAEHKNFVATRSRDQLKGTLTLGAVLSVLNYTLPKAIKSLEKSYPKLRLRFVDSRQLSRDLVERVRGGEIDVALIVGPPEDASEVVWRPYAVERFFVIAPADTQGTTAEELLRSGPYLRYVPNLPIEHLIEKEIARKNINPEVHMELDTFENIFLMASSGLGVGVIPERYAKSADLGQMRLAPFGGPTLFRELGVVYHMDCEKTPLIDVLFSELVEFDFPVRG